MKYVLDSSVAFKWEVPETDSGKAILLRDDFIRGTHDLIAPDFFPLELAHALTRAERQNRLVQGQATLFWAAAMSTPPLLSPALSLALRAVEISSQMRIGVYDCLYIALAEQNRCEFITADDRLVNNIKHAFPFVTLLATLP